MALILAVDDEPSILKLVTATLEAKGHEVLTADSGIERPEDRAAPAS